MSKFDSIVAGYMRRLINDLGVTVLDSAAVFGNGGHESGGFEKLQEERPTVKGSAGGYGWFQWTGPRRRAFMAFCKNNALAPASDEASYRFLVHELRGGERGALGAMARVTSLKAKVEAFEMAYERAGIKHYPSRLAYAKRALAAYEKVANPPVKGPEPRLPEPEEVPLPQEKPACIPGLDKPLPKSTTFWATLVSMVSGVFAALANLDPMVQALLVFVILGAGIWIIRERRRYGALARKEGV